MSRIHEAVKKAVLEQQPAAVPTMSTVEGILSASYTLNGAGLPAKASVDAPGHPSPGADLLQGVHTGEWDPDKKRMLFFADDPDTPGREQFRSLRVKLYQLREKRDLKVIAVGSSLSGEGKSFVASNVAHALSLQREQKVLLVDCDLRRGSIAGFLGARPTPGLAEYLRNQQPLEAVLQRAPSGNLFVIPSGAHVPDPGELIGSLRMRELVSHLRPHFDWIVIDTPPAVQFADSGVIANLCDGVLFVLGSGLTPVPIAKRAVHSLREDRILGIVLNRAEDADQAAKYFSYYRPPETDSSE